MGLIIEIIYIIVLILIILTNIFMLKFRKELKSIPNETNLSGIEVARKLSSKLTDEEPHIIKKKGLFLDYYDSTRNVIKLTPEVFDGTDMYACALAANIALLTNKAKRNQMRNYNINNFLVIMSYIMIILGALMNNSNIIYFGMIIFIISFIFQILLLEIFAKNEEEINDIYKLIKKEKVLKPFGEDEESYVTIMCMITIARLPYGFINYFR